MQLVILTNIKGLTLKFDIIFLVLYRLYLDESGDHKLGPSLPKDQPHIRFLGLSGVILNKETAENLFLEFENQKRKYFKGHDFDIDPALILHRKDICDGIGVFSILKNDEQVRRTFDGDILKIIHQTPFTLITVVIDKWAHFRQHKEKAFPPYEYCLQVLMERYFYFLKNADGKGDVLAESRGGKEDEDLKNSYKKIYLNDKYVNFKERLTSEEIKIKKKSQNIAGLQLCDLLVHDSMYEILEEEGVVVENKPNSFRKSLMCILQTKYYRSDKGKIRGCGKKFLGNKKSEPFEF